MLHLLPRFDSFASIDIDLRFLVIMAIPITIFIVGGIIAIVAMHFHNRRREMWHETVRLAIEKGQPLPQFPARHLTVRVQPANDVRSGLILIGVGAGLAIFFVMVRASQVAGVGAIPGLIGVALLIHAIISPRRDEPTTPPPQS